MSDMGEEREERAPYGVPEGLEPDPLAEKLTPDGAVMLVGILGRGPTEEDWHLFLDRELTRRAEFKASDVLHSEKIREEDPPFLGTQGTRVYLRRGARVVYTTTRSREVQAEFLRGDIGTGVTAEAGLAGLPGAQDIPPTFTPLISILVTCIPASEDLGCWGSRYLCYERGARAFPRASGNPVCETAAFVCDERIARAFSGVPYLCESFICESAVLALCNPRA
jgi:hypothetical protein